MQAFAVPTIPPSPCILCKDLKWSFGCLPLFLFSIIHSSRGRSRQPDTLLLLLTPPPSLLFGNVLKFIA
ncbi:hypothetical protein XENTR_v10015879 [Xenopus tropicalis]|nr:hypothetical protein XENTR_v10015879 [Xenopus tropicalis]